MKTRAQYTDWLHRQMVRMEPLDDTPKPDQATCEKVATIAGKMAARHGLGGEPYRQATKVEGPEDVLSLLADCLRLLNETPEPPTTGGLTVAQAATRLGCSQRSLYDMVGDGRISHYRVGGGRGSIRFRPEDLADYQQSTRLPAVPDPLPQPAFRHLT
jgi:excisionase family DNA binding protein